MKPALAGAAIAIGLFSCSLLVDGDGLSGQRSGPSNEAATTATPDGSSTDATSDATSDDAGGALPSAGWQLVAGLNFTCLKTPMGVVKCWGDNSLGQLGRPANLGQGNIAQPVDFGPGRSAKRLAASGSQACAILDDDTLRCWGSDDHQGVLGYGSRAGTRNANDPTRISLGGDDRAVTLHVAAAKLCASRPAGSLKCWGLNDVGTLGLERAYDRDAGEPDASPMFGDEPGEVPSLLPDVQFGNGTLEALSGSRWNTCALLQAGTLRCWGEPLALLRGSLPNVILTRSRGQSDYAAIAATWSFNSNSIGLT